ncbi:MFS transporter [Pullulanibacillus sp. KACC 23026]|uniref:MFS transporter n=1 Tax=Pullulanibacillus sp. KACC 23026 TaxID=3028315 RepID=UPI0023AFA5E0|nr:MFS transporter [Pullulanibacillus sp. KACC 23026]WEG12182.1 MFS transporter [Pullulanibacillus sp. KACC 23026]
MSDPAVSIRDKQLPRLRRNYPVFRFMGGNLISFFGDQIYLIAFPLIILKLTGSPLSMGIVAALERLPIWLQPVTGVLEDRVNKKRLLLICDLGRGVLIGLIASLYLLQHLDMWEIYGGALLIGMMSQIYNTSQFASIPRLVREQDLQAANSINSSFSKTAVLLGPGLGGWIVSFYNPGYALLINSLSFFVSFLTVASLPIVTAKSPSRSNVSFYKELMEGFRFVFKTKPILYTNLSILISMAGATLFLTMMIYYLKTPRHLTADQIGWLLSLGGAASILGALSTNWLLKRVSRRGLLFGASFIGGLSIILFSCAHSFVWLVICNAIGDFLASIMNPVIVTLRQALTPDHLLGRVQATSRFMSWIFLPLSSFLSGVLALHLGSAGTILIGGLLSAGASFFYLHSSLK